MNLIHGDCIEVMAGMEPESVDAICTDPPYGLEFMGKEWDKLAKFRKPSARDKERRTNAEWGRGVDTLSDRRQPSAYVGGTVAQAWHQQWAEAAFRVAKPSAYLLAFGGTRTVHRMTCAIEDAGWIIRDMLVWGYASGFPKSKASLKPAWEPIVMARKPGPLRELAIDECRIPGEMNPADYDDTRRTSPKFSGIFGDGHARRDQPADAPAGRWPANIVLTDPIFDGGIEGVVGGGTSESGSRTGQYDGSASWSGEYGPVSRAIDGDSGTYSRFFLVPKADRTDREPVLGGLAEREAGGHVGQKPGKRMGRTADEGANVRDLPQRANHHPTVKPVDLMRHLVRLVTPTGGTVLDPFLGSGTTAIAAELEGFPWIGIERELEYIQIAEARLNGTQRGLGLDSPAPTPKPRHASIENTTAKRAAYGRKPHEGTTWRLHGHPPIDAPIDEEAP